MKERFWRNSLLMAGALLIVAAAALLSVPPAQAQCGSQASSCKNCHEVQGAMPVNNKGEWHTAHAFGDFCEFCHAGNVQATEKDQAHTGMVDPLSDVKASCASCHPGDLQQRAQVYAVALGVEIGSGSSGAASQGTPPSGPGNPGGTNDQQTISVLPGSGLVVDDPNVIDYTRRYEETVLGKHNTNWGNVILAVMIGFLVVGGGGFVLFNEGWVQITTEPLKPVPEGYPEELVAMLPKLKRLTEKGRRGLQTLVEEPEAADELLDVIARHTGKGAQGA